MRQITCALIFSCFALTAAWGQATGKNNPRLLPTDEPNIAPIVDKTVINAAALDLVDDQGKLRGTSVAERLEQIRRRAVDVDISKPFSVTGETDPDLIQSHGALPKVPRRSIQKTSKPISTRPKSAAAPKPVPTPLAVPQPKPEQKPVAVSQPKPEPKPVAVSQPKPEPKPVVTPPPTPEQKPVVVPQPKSEPEPAPMPVLSAQSEAEPVVSRETIPEKPLRTPVITKEIKEESDILLSNHVPSLSFETAGPKRILIGREAKYRVSMLNRGKIDARDVVVTVRLPAWAEVTRTNSTIGTPQVELEADRSYVVHWKMDQLAAKGQEDLIMNILPRDSRPFDLAVGWTLAAAQTTTQIQVQEPKLEMSINGAREALYGETSVYTITLSNPGTGTAENVVLSLMPVTTQQDIAGSRNIGSLEEGERKTIELELTAHQAGLLQVKAVASAEGGLRAEAAQDVHVRRANLEISIIGPPRNFAGTEATYKINIENTGDATADKALAAAGIPAGANYISSNDGGKFDSQSGQIEWQVGSLRPGAVRVLEFLCVLETPGENRIDILAQAEDDLRITKTVVTSVEALADLKLHVNDPKGPISVGQDSVYEVKIVNRGTKAAEHIEVVGYFSEGIEPVDVRGWRGEVSTGQVVFEPIGTLAAGQELVIRITARANRPGDHIFRAQIKCNSPETRLAVEEWTKYYSMGETDVRQVSRPTAKLQQTAATQQQPQIILP